MLGLMAGVVSAQVEPSQREPRYPASLEAPRLGIPDVALLGGAGQLDRSLFLPDPLRRYSVTSSGTSWGEIARQTQRDVMPIMGDATSKDVDMRSPSTVLPRSLLRQRLTLTLPRKDSSIFLPPPARSKVEDRDVSNEGVPDLIPNPRRPLAW